MFEHTVYADHLKVMIDRPKQEIEDYLEHIYNKAVTNFQNKSKTQICIYYSGAGCQVIDPSTNQVRQVGFASRGTEPVFDLAN